VAKPIRPGDQAGKQGAGGAAPGRVERSGHQASDEDPLAAARNAEVNTAFAFALRQALTDAAPAPSPVKEKDKEEKKTERKRCADCWNCIIFKEEGGQLMGRCRKNLWLRPTYSYEEINSDRVRRWHADCPEYDDSE
jgi:hypothetical protein